MDTEPDPIPGQTVVLCYHAVSEDWPSSMAVRPGSLKRQVESFLRRGFKALTFTEALTRTSPDPAFAVTFDDAYESVVSLGLPVLADLGVPGTVFVPTRADKDGIRYWQGITEWGESTWRSELKGATRDQLAALSEAGWELGSHTRTHPDLRRLSDEELREELEGSKLDCEDLLGVECTSIAYPYGHVDQRVAKAARDAGYSAAAALAADDLSASPYGRFSWPRLAVYRGDTRARYWLKRVAFIRARQAFGFVQSHR